MTRVAMASFAGTAIEFYDFFMYGTAAALVFPHLFLPTLGPTSATVAPVNGSKIDPSRRVSSKLGRNIFRRSGGHESGFTRCETTYKRLVRHSIRPNGPGPRHRAGWRKRCESRGRDAELMLGVAEVPAADELRAAIDRVRRQGAASGHQPRSHELSA